ncbi:T9SS type A sorting domain-containing protein [Panacibacter ginsenosidivorans]|nr:T9SS type A sorting domain-containing protein [Panacibacter ginsenosidivorans]
MKKKSIFFGLVFVTCSNISFNAIAQATDVQDSLALVDLYISTNGPGWTTNTNWLKGPVSTWYGIKVGDDSRVWQIGLTNNNLEGSIPSSIGDLTSLNNLYLSGNNLTGSIPPEIGVPYFYNLYLNGNQLSGSIPPELGNHSYGYDSWYDLSDNQLSGSIPPELGNLGSVTWLNLSNNQLSGSIPPELGSIGVTDYGPNLDLSNNLLSGTIPPELANIATNSWGGLASLDLSYNQLSGSIPPEFGNIDEDRGFSLNISSNRFTFDGMELIAEKLPGTQYDHQKRIPLHLNNGVLSASAGGTLSNNTYKWYGFRSNGHARVIVTGDSVFHPTKSGVYYLRVFNAVATGLILRSDTIYYREPPATVASEDNLQANENKTLFMIYPNPAKDILHVQTNGNTSFSLLNQNGKILLIKNVNGSGTIDVSKITAGVYYLINNSNREVKKIIVEK